MGADEIRNMPAGDEMDVLVAEKVMGLHREYDDDGFIGFVDDAGEWPKQRYSTDIAAAWEVVEKFQRRELHLIWTAGEPPQYTCVFGDSARGHGETAPLAICRAALLAVAPPPPR